MVLKRSSEDVRNRVNRVKRVKRVNKCVSHQLCLSSAVALTRAQDSPNPESTGDSQPGTEPDSESDSKSTPIGPIIGGVVGGVAGLAAIALIAWMLIRRRNNNNRHDELLPAEAPTDAYYAAPKTAPMMHSSELASTFAYKELPAQSITRPEAPVEMDGTPMETRRSLL